MGQCVGQQARKKPPRKFSLSMSEQEPSIHKSMSCPTMGKAVHYHPLVPNWMATVPGVCEKNFGNLSKPILSNGSAAVAQPNQMLKKAVVKSRPKVSRWFDEDRWFQFLLQVHNGDILELRHDKTYHWGVALRAQKKGGRFSPNVSVFHIIHGPSHHGRVILNTMEEFWTAGSKIRINNSINGELGVVGRGRPSHEVIQRAFKAVNSSTYKWHQCTQFVHWCSSQPPAFFSGGTSTLTWEKS